MKIYDESKIFIVNKELEDIVTQINNIMKNRILTVKSEIAGTFR